MSQDAGDEKKERGENERMEHLPNGGDVLVSFVPRKDWDYRYQADGWPGAVVTSHLTGERQKVELSPARAAYVPKSGVLLLLK